jgi:hypothetical protein
MWVVAVDVVGDLDTRIERSYPGINLGHLEVLDMYGGIWDDQDRTANAQ